MKFWLGPLLYALSLIPGLFLFLLSVLFLFAFVQVLANARQQLIGQFIAVGILLGLLWFAYMHLPHFIKTSLRKAVGRPGKSKGRNEHHGH